MSIYFRSTPVTEPLAFLTLGTIWKQPQVSRSEGYPQYHYLMTQSGKGLFQVAGMSYTLEEGQGILVAPFVPHSYHGLTEPWITAYATISGTMVGSIEGILGGRSVIFTDRHQGSAILQLIEQTLSQLQASPANVRAASVSCYDLLLHMTDGVYNRDLRDEPLYCQYVAPVMQEIETGYQTKLTAETLSRRVFVSPQYLSRLFRRFLGCSTYEYLVAYRMTKAKELLLSNPRLAVQNVAHQTGFEDVSHFIATFRRSTGMTPTEFRVLNLYPAE